MYILTPLPVYEYEKETGNSFWDHLEPSRLSVPKYALNLLTWPDC